MTPKISSVNNTTLSRHNPSTDAELHEYGFRGYSISELRHQLMLNRIKTEIARDKLMQLVSPRVQRKAGYVSGIRAFFRYFDIAMLSFTIFRRLTSIVRLLRPRSK